MLSYLINRVRYTNLYLVREPNFLLRRSLPNYCLECGGNLSYDPAIKQYACKSCGLTFTQQNLLEGREKMLRTEESADEEKKRRHKDYLKWWLSDKKK